MVSCRHERVDVFLNVTNLVRNIVVVVVVVVACWHVTTIMSSLAGVAPRYEVVVIYDSVSDCVSASTARTNGFQFAYRSSPTVYLHALLIII